MVTLPSGVLIPGAALFTYVVQFIARFVGYDCTKHVISRLGHTGA
jgi:hypothetical protein